MKRSKYVQLSLAASVAMAISGCGPTEKTYAVQKKYNFQSVQQCADEKLPVDVCSDAYMTAMAEHRRIAPVYDNQADCDADFVADWCQQDSAGKFIPKLGGFELTRRWRGDAIPGGRCQGAIARLGSEQRRLGLLRHQPADRPADRQHAEQQPQQLLLRAGVPLSR